MQICVGRYIAKGLVWQTGLLLDFPEYPQKDLEPIYLIRVADIDQNHTM